MNYLTKQFLSCTPINKMDFTIFNRSKDFSLNLYTQGEILNNTVNSKLIKRYPIKISYQRAFLRLLMQKVEESNNETHDELYTTYCKLVSLSDEGSVHYRHFLLDNGTLDCITLQESTNLISEGTTGLCSWQGAIILSKWCTENKEKFHKKNVLELGCGVGLTGISVVSACSPKQYVFSDCHLIVLNMLCKNIKLNFLENKSYKALNTSTRLKLQLKYEQTEVQVIHMKWEDIDKYITESLFQPDIVIAADVLYDSDLFISLIKGLKHLLTPNCYAIIAATIRNTDTISQFFHLLGDHGLTFEECILPKEQIVTIQSIDSPVQILKIFQKT